MKKTVGIEDYNLVCAERDMLKEQCEAVEDCLERSKKVIDLLVDTLAKIEHKYTSGPREKLK